MESDSSNNSNSKRETVKEIPKKDLFWFKIRSMFSGTDLRKVAPAAVVSAALLTPGVVAGQEDPSRGEPTQSSDTDEGREATPTPTKVPFATPTKIPFSTPIPGPSKFVTIERATPTPTEILPGLEETTEPVIAPVTETMAGDAEAMPDSVTPETGEPVVEPEATPTKLSFATPTRSPKPPFATPTSPNLTPKP